MSRVLVKSQCDVIYVDDLSETLIRRIRSKNLLELEGCFVQIESSSVAFSDVERNVSGVERFNHCSCSLLKKCTRGYESVEKMNKEKL